MTEEKQTLLIIRGTIASTSLEDQRHIAAAVQDMRQVLAKYPNGHAQMAIALLGAELAAES